MERVHENKLRSHTQMNFDEYEKLDAKGKAEVEKKLEQIILERIPKEDETERVFEKRWVVSLYIRYIPKPKPKKKATANDKNGKVVSKKKATDKKGKLKKNSGESFESTTLEEFEELSDAMKIKEGRPTSTNRKFVDAEMTELVSEAKQLLTSK